MKNIMAILLIVVSGGLFYIFIGPTYEQAQSQAALKAQYDDAVNNSQKVLGLRDELLNKYNGFSVDDRTRLNKLLPPYIDNIRLIIEMENIASANHLILKNLSLPTDVAPTPSGAGEMISIPTISAVSVSNFSFGVTATYDQYLAFLRVLEGSLRLFDITAISFSGIDPKTGVAEFQTSFNTYFMQK